MPVYKRGNSYWIAFAINRRRYRKRSPDNSYQGAQAYEALIRQRLARGQPLEEPKPEKQYRFRDIALEWLEVTVKNNNKPSDYSIKKYLFNAHILPYLGNRYLEQIDCYTIEQYKALLIKKGYSEKTINNHLSIINCCFKAAIERNIIKNSPRVKLLKVLAPPYDLLTESEVMQLINHSNGKWHNIILLVVRTGLRIGEVLALKWENIDLNSKILTVRENRVRGIEGTPKSNRIRIIPLVPSVLTMLTAQIKKSGYVFRDEYNQPLKYNACLRNLHRICVSSGLRKIGWHVLRHTFASHLGAKPNSVFAIKELLGHKDMNTTLRYVHVTLPVLQNTIQSLEPANQNNATMVPHSSDMLPRLNFQNLENLKNY